MNQPIQITAEQSLLNYLRSMLVSLGPSTCSATDVSRLFDTSAIAPNFWGFAVTLYQSRVDRLMVVRAAQSVAIENVRQVMRQLPRHPRFGEFVVGDWQRCRMQVDFILNEPQLIELAELSDSVLPDEPVGSKRYLASSEFGGQRYIAAAYDPENSNSFAPWQIQVNNWSEVKKLTRFELGVDGLRIVKEGKRRYFLPGDAFVHSILGMGQLRRHIQRLFPGDDIEQLTYYRFRSLSFVSAIDVGSAVRTDAIDADSTFRAASPTKWLPLYRGLPPIPEVNSASLTQAARAGTKWIVDNVQEDGRFTYYYDAATDRRRDHEHPGRDPETDPYYNLLRHCGGVITLLLDEQLWRARGGRESFSANVVSMGDGVSRKRLPTPSTATPLNLVERRREVIEHATDFFVRQLVEYKTADGQDAAYALYNRKAKLGGSGVGLCTLTMYQRLFDDDRYAGSAERLAKHLISEINDQGEFRYYHIYLDKPVAWKDNQKYFSFYYPGEAVLGLSQYCQHVIESEDERRLVFDKVHQALRFLLRDRPQLHKEHYQTLPADSWLMMGINDLWDVAEFQQDEYKTFVFGDADQMVRQMYTEADALYPDYVGSFYYRYGDHPYPDGARAEGLLAAYQLALKVGDEARIERYRDACNKVASATLRLCNTVGSMYSAAHPERAIGGIRFKLTRQWFRVDTIQHVASFYLKLVATLTK